jgi:hypothetical protein
MLQLNRIAVGCMVGLFMAVMAGCHNDPPLSTEMVGYWTATPMSDRGPFIQLNSDGSCVACLPTVLAPPPYQSEPCVNVPQAKWKIDSAGRLSIYNARQTDGVYVSFQPLDIRRAGKGYELEASKPDDGIVIEFVKQ